MLKKPKMLKKKTQLCKKKSKPKKPKQTAKKSNDINFFTSVSQQDSKTNFDSKKK